MKKLKILVRIIFVLSFTMSTSFNRAGYAAESFGQLTVHKEGASWLSLSDSYRFTSGGPVSSSPPQGLMAPTPEAAPREDDLILLRAETIDTSKRPSLDKADIQAGLRLMGLNSSDTAYYLVQFSGPIQEKWKAAVREAGGKLFGFVPNHAFIVKMNGAIAEKVAALPTVKWIGLYHPDYKIAPRLAAKAQAASEPIVVTVMTFEPSAVEEVASAIEELGGQALDWQAGSRWGLVRAEIEPAPVAEIARLVEVSWIETFVAPQLTNDVARGAELMNVDVVHQDYELTGAGQIVGHADTGLDVGDLATLHPDLRDRVKSAFAWGRRALASFASPGSGPMGLTWDGTYLWNIDWYTDELYKLTLSGQMIASCEPNVAKLAAGLVWDGDGFWYVERDNDTIYRLDTACNVLDSFSAPETRPSGLAWDGANLWISDTGEDIIYQVTTSGTVLQSFPSPGPHPSSLLWVGGYLWCGDSTDDVIYKLDASGNVLERLPIPGYSPQGLAWDGASIWVTDPGLDEIYKLSLTPTTQGDWGDPNGHGTHTAASILGTGAAYAGNGSPDAGQYRGVAPGAQLVHQSVMDGNGSLTGIPLDLTTLFQQAYDEGARIHSDSWGASVDGEYTEYSSAADAFMWDYKDMLLVFSAGNSGVDANSDGIVDVDSTGAPATAKNVLTVGASENYRPTIDVIWSSSRFRANPIRGDERADNTSGLAAFSSRGPTDDGRIKPDVVAPGTFIISARSQKWPFFDDFESTVVSTSSTSPDMVSQRGECEPKVLTDRDIVSPPHWQPTNWEANVTLMTCTAETDAKIREETIIAAATTADWTATGNWELVTSDNHSPNHAWASENYSRSAYDKLTSPAMDVRSGADVVGFWTRYDLEDGDKGIVFFSDDGGDDWIGYSFTGSQPSWMYRWFPIPWGACWIVGWICIWGWCFPIYECLTDASNLQVRFVLDGDSDSVTGEGWWIDDVRIHPLGWGLLSDYGVAEAGSDQDEYYTFMGGTSMSAPLTAGAAALVRQFYTDREEINPSAALVKATLINGATDMTPGQYGVGSANSPLFSDDMESGTGNWVADNPWALTTSKSHSPDHSWADSPDGNYSNYADVSLTLADSFDLSATPNPGLVFWHQYDIEYGFDYGFVEISANNGISWTQELAVTGTMTEWVRSVVDLSPYSSETAVKIRFRLDSDNTVTRDGWNIDDVSIEPVSFQEIATRPDHAQGWGKVNLGYSIFPTEPRRMIYFDASDGLWTGETDNVNFNVTDSSEPLRVTLVWTDYPSTIAAAINLVNNLDLKLIGPGSTVYHPNGLDTADVLNNVEDIDVASPPPGAYTVEINGTEVTEGPQPYALVISGAVSRGPELVVTKSDDPDPVQAGGLLTYTIVVSNISSLDATGVIITDTIPASTTFAWASDGGSYHPGPPQTVTWSDLGVAAGESITISCQVTVDSPSVHGTVLTNTVEAVPAQGVGSTDTITTTVFLPPIASFTSDSPVCSGQTMHFTDTSQYAATYLWNFGDNEISTDRNPTHVYSIGGNYTATLTVTNAISSDAYSDTVTVNLPPEAAFSYEPTTAFADTRIYFTDESTNNPTSWLWDFGDGNQSILQNPTHVYGMTDTFTVTLTATNDCGSGLASEAVKVIEQLKIYLPLVLKNH